MIWPEDVDLNNEELQQRCELKIEFVAQVGQVGRANWLDEIQWCKRYVCVYLCVIYVNIPMSVCDTTWVICNTVHRV